MHLKDIREAYYNYSGTASTIARQIAFAGIAIIWIFKKEGPGFVALQINLYWPLIFLVVTLSADLLQYVVSAAIWGVLNRYSEKKFGPNYEGDIGVLPYFNWPGIAFFWTKLISLIIGYVLLGSYAASSVGYHY